MGVLAASHLMRQATPEQPEDIMSQTASAKWIKRTGYRYENLHYFGSFVIEITDGAKEAIAALRAAGARVKMEKSDRFYVVTYRTNLPYTKVRGALKGFGPVVVETLGQVRIN